MDQFQANATHRPDFDGKLVAERFFRNMLVGVIAVEGGMNRIARDRRQRCQQAPGLGSDDSKHRGQRCSLIRQSFCLPCAGIQVLLRHPGDIVMDLVAKFGAILSSIGPGCASLTESCPFPQIGDHLRLFSRCFNRIGADSVRFRLG